MHSDLLICGLTGSIQAAGPSKQGPVLWQKGAAVYALFLGRELWVKNTRLLLTQWKYNLVVKGPLGVVIFLVIFLSMFCL